jgi:hypothetical protein
VTQGDPAHLVDRVRRHHQRFHERVAASGVGREAVAQVREHDLRANLVRLRVHRLEALARFGPRLRGGDHY